MKEHIMNIALEEAKRGIANQDGGPFGAVIVDKDGNVVSVGHNKVLSTKDPTNHAEVVAIREACKKLNTEDLSGYSIYSTCEPCPMCLSAIIWSNISNLYYASTRYDAASIGFRDQAIYDYLANKNEIIKKEKIDSKACDEMMKNYEGEIY